MAKFLKLSGGNLTEDTSISTSAGAADVDKIPELDGSGRLDVTFMPVGIGADTQSILAGESLSAGDFVNIYDDASTLKVRKADASALGTHANGYVLDAVTSGQQATVYFEGRNTSVTGLTIGLVYWLDDVTAGGLTTTAPTGAGVISQRIGKATGATSITTEIAQPIVQIA